MEERINSIIKKLEQISTRGIDTILMGQALSELLALREAANRKNEDEDDNDKC